MILEHEHQWAAAPNGRFEGCGKDGCTAGRFSRDWIETMTSSRRALPRDVGLPVPQEPPHE